MMRDSRRISSDDAGLKEDLHEWREMVDAGDGVVAG